MANTSEDSDKKKERLLCNSCGEHTWHYLLFSYSVTHPIYEEINPDPIEEYSEYWEILQCMGCDSVTIRLTNEFPWETELQYEFYPERTGGYHHEKKYQNLPENLHRLYSEVVIAFNKNTLLLCAAGLRALLEGLCDEKGIIEGPNERGKITKSLEGKINGLTSIVPTGIVKNLHGLRFLGNQALHELETPSKVDLELALAVVEDILNVVYDLNYKSQLLYEKVTRRSVSSSEESDDNIPS